MSMIYLDHAATTPVRPEVLEEMLPYLKEMYGNPSGLCQRSMEAAKAVETARKRVADSLGCEPEEIYFTSGGTEADNWALKSSARMAKNRGVGSVHIITSQVEHHAVLHACEALERAGAAVTCLPVDERGRVSPAELERAIRPDTALISIMYANNEVGAIQPVREIGAIARSHHICFHTDAVQAYGHLPISVNELGIDMLSASGHKCGAPKGIGFLYIRKGVKIRSFIHGGAQERKRRAGTENVPGIVGLGKAVELAASTMEERAERETKLRDYTIARIEKEIPYCRLNGDRVKRLPNNINFSFRFIEGESMLIKLDLKGICASSGSACTSGSLDPSHVLLAIGLPHEIAHGSLRMTLGADTTKEDLDYTVDCLKQIVEEIRSMSPLYEDFIKKTKKENQ